MIKRALFALALFALFAGAQPKAHPSWLGLGFTNHVSGKEQWLVVRFVVPGGPAQQAGAQSGDVITAIDGKPLRFHNSVELLEWLARIPPRSRTKWSVLRGTRHLELVLVPIVMTDEQFARWKQILELARQQRDRR